MNTWSCLDLWVLIVWTKNIIFSEVLQLFLLQNKIFLPWTVRAVMEHALLVWQIICNHLHHDLVIHSTFCCNKLKILVIGTNTNWIAIMLRNGAHSDHRHKHRLGQLQQNLNWLILSGICSDIHWKVITRIFSRASNFFSTTFWHTVWFAMFERSLVKHEHPNLNLEFPTPISKFF